jgi:hypothetical protein
MSNFTSAFEDEPTPEEAGETEESTPETFYANPIEFFADLLGPSYVREVNGGSEFVWCPQWYKHVEALTRVEALWRAWEHLRLDGALGISTWWINHADPHMSILMAPNGPFKKCIYDGHKERTTPELLSLPHLDPSEGLYH